MNFGLLFSFFLLAQPVQAPKNKEKKLDCDLAVGSFENYYRSKIAYTVRLDPNVHDFKLDVTKIYCSNDRAAVYVVVQLRVYGEKLKSVEEYVCLKTFSICILKQPEHTQDVGIVNFQVKKTFPAVWCAEDVWPD